MKKITVITIYFLLAGLLSIVLTSAYASDTPAPSSVTVTGSLQSELGCPGDWQPDCAATHLVFNANDNVWQRSFSVPAGNWEYKAALNGSWTENYGGGGVRNGANIPLTLAVPANVKFYYDHETHWITDNVNSVIVTAAGSFQSEIGCSGDWDPSCLRSWLQDPDGDGIYTFRTKSIPPGNYEVKAAINESWAVNYGVGGVPGGANILFTVPPATIATIFSYNANSHILSVSSESKKSLLPSIAILLLSETTPPPPKPDYNAVIGVSSVRIPRSDACGRADGRLCESLIGDLTTDAMRITYNTDFAITNAGGIRANLTCPSPDVPGDSALLTLRRPI